MLIPVDILYPKVPQVTPKTDGETIVRNMLTWLKKEPWFETLYQDVVVNQRKTYTIKCKYPIDVTKQPTLYEGYQVKYTWDGRCEKYKDIYNAVNKFRELYWKEQWFYDVASSKDELLIEVTLKSWLNPNHRLDYFEDFPVRYAIKPKEKEEELKNVIP